MLQRDPGYRFRMRATATDQGKEPKDTTIDLEIVVETVEGGVDAVVAFIEHDTVEVATLAALATTSR